MSHFSSVAVVYKDLAALTDALRDTLDGDRFDVVTPEQGDEAVELINYYHQPARKVQVLIVDKTGPTIPSSEKGQHERVHLLGFSQLHNSDVLDVVCDRWMLSRMWREWQQVIQEDLKPQYARQTQIKALESMGYQYTEERLPDNTIRITATQPQQNQFATVTL